MPNIRCRWSSRSREFQLARWISSDDRKKLDAFVAANNSGIADDVDGDPVFMAKNEFYLGYTRERAEGIDVLQRQGREEGVERVNCPRLRKEVNAPGLMPGSAPIMFTGLPHEGSIFMLRRIVILSGRYRRRVEFCGSAAAQRRQIDATPFSHAPCSVLDGRPCTPSFCSVFNHGPCIPEIDYPYGENLQLTIQTVPPQDEAAKYQKPDHDLDNIGDLFAALRSCWSPPRPTMRARACRCRCASASSAAAR